MFGGFFKRRKYRPVRFGEIDISCSSGYDSNVLVLFFENDNGKRKYTVKRCYTCHFKSTKYYVSCEIWKNTGLYPEWAKDPVAEKLSR